MMHDIRHTTYGIRHTRYERAFTIAEVLIVLAITGILLTAVAVAFNASIINYRQNEQMFKTINNARQALCRMTSQLRTANPEFGAVDPTDPNNRCSLHTATNEDITYQFCDAADPDYPNTLLLITNNGNKYVLCENVTSMSFIKTPTADGLDCKSVQMSMTVQSPDQVGVQRTLSAAAVIRRNLD
jgi:prepilin-type N-terminal cleavage/methylation domain-containing protein